MLPQSQITGGNFDGSNNYRNSKNTFKHYEMHILICKRWMQGIVISNSKKSKNTAFAKENNYKRIFFC